MSERERTASGGPVSLSKNLDGSTTTPTVQGELEGAKPASNEIQMPRDPLRGTGRGERSEDFCAAQLHENQA